MGRVFLIWNEKEMHFLPITTFMRTYRVCLRYSHEPPRSSQNCAHHPVKILVLFLVLSLAALAITGYFAFSAITNVGTYAQGSSQALGAGVVNNSSAALLSLGEQYPVRIASDQANITDVFLRTLIPRWTSFQRRLQNSSAIPRLSLPHLSIRRTILPSVPRSRGFARFCARGTSR